MSLAAGRLAGVRPSCNASNRRQLQAGQTQAGTLQTRMRWPDRRAIVASSADIAQEQHATSSGQTQGPAYASGSNGNGRHAAATVHSLSPVAASAVAQATVTPADARAGAASSSASGLGGTDAAKERSNGYEGIQMQPQRASGLYVRVRNMLKHFRTTNGVFKAVDGIDIDIEPSTIVALLGPSGSGKTTMLRLVAGLEQPTAGRILFDDTDATNLPVQERHIGMVFQSYALFNHKTVAENIKFGLEVRKVAVNHDKRCADLLELVQLTGLGDRYPRQLSGGQRQRVALARALASNPNLLLLDEPFGALDAVVRKQLRSGLKEIVRSVGVTTIIVTHDQEEAFDLADKVVIFNRGLVEQQGPPTEIIAAPATPFVMKFVGDTNVVPANCLLVRRSRYVTSKARVMFRPTDIQLFIEYMEQVDGHSVTPVTIKDRINLGWTIKYVLAFDDDVEVEWSVSREQGQGAYNLDVGQRVYMYVKPGAMMGFNDEEIDSAPLV